MLERRIVWDAKKDQINRAKHGIGFDEAPGILFDPLSLTVDDLDHSFHERRFISIGVTKTDRLYVVF